MNELIAGLSQRVGLSPDQARSAVEHVMGFLKEKLPAPLAAHLDGVTAEKPDDSQEEAEAPLDAGSLLGKVSSMFGK